MRLSLSFTFALLVLLSAGNSPAADGSSVFASVSVDRRQLNASLDDKISLTLTLRRAGTLDVLVVDRDGFAVRQLAKGAAAPATANRLH